MDRRQAASGNLSPGWDRAGFRLLRQGAQQAGDTARDTEIGLSNAVREGRMGASTELARNALTTAGMQSQNTLSGYGRSGDLDISKQGQISRDIEAGGGLGLSTQQLINQSRLGGAGGLQQEALTRAGIGASAGSASAGREQQQSQWEQEMAQRDREVGNKGLLETYGATPNELLFNQNLQRDYRNDMVNVGLGDINSRIGASNIPGLGSSIRQGLGTAGDIAGIAGGGFGGLSNFRPRKTLRRRGDQGAGG